MTEIWKIAPGNRAEDWPVFSELGCIAIGWLEGRDFRRFKDRASVLVALEAKYGKGSKGNGDGAAGMIWSFTHEIKQGDVVVANDAYNRAVGIGIIKGNYLPPTSDDNPLHDDTTTHRHHARLVDWVIKKPVDIPGGRLFVQATLAALNDDKVAMVKQSYLAAYPGDTKLASQLEQLLGDTFAPTTPTASDVADVKPERAATTTYRILRDTALARRVKVLHKYQCQICGHTIMLADGSRYAEAHHIKPLGSPHDGFDIIGNILCLCPNHHAECDLGAVKLSMSALRFVDGHKVAPEFVDYHNKNIYGVTE